MWADKVGADFAAGGGQFCCWAPSITFLPAALVNEQYKAICFCFGWFLSPAGRNVGGLSPATKPAPTLPVHRENAAFADYMQFGGWPGKICQGSFCCSVLPWADHVVPGKEMGWPNYIDLLQSKSILSDRVLYSSAWST